MILPSCSPQLRFCSTLVCFDIVWCLVRHVYLHRQFIEDVFGLFHIFIFYYFLCINSAQLSIHQLFVYISVFMSNNFLSFFVSCYYTFTVTIIAGYFPTHIR